MELIVVSFADVKYGLQSISGDPADNVSLPRRLDLSMELPTYSFIWRYKQTNSLIKQVYECVEWKMHKQTYMKILNQVPVSVYNVRIRSKPYIIENIWFENLQTSLF